MARHLKRGMDASAVKAADAQVRATVEQFLGWFPGVKRDQVDAVLEHAARSAQAA